MRRLTVQTAPAYECLIGQGLLEKLGAFMREAGLSGDRVLVVTDSHVAPLYAARVLESLESAAYASALCTFEAGEARKRLSTIEEIYTALAAHEMGRGDVIVALGGGVTGDMAGFAAATWMRGIAFVQVPTTLLAQVDSSVGGKTGVDLSCGKNLVGAFWQPSLVVADVDTLDTLSADIFADGMAEIIKHACIRDAALFSQLEAGDWAREAVVAQNIAIKRDIVVADVRERGLRGLLNFGHTAGHALELHSDYTLSHGRAVAIGMCIMARVGEHLGITASGIVERLERLLQQYGLPTSLDADGEWASLMAADKKRSGGTLNLVLLREIGDGMLYPMVVTEAIALVQKLCS